MDIKAAIFDLDGVIVSTDEYHYKAWKKIADEESIYFDREINERLRGVGRMESLDIILEKSKKNYSLEEKVELAERKNTLYRELLNNLSSSDILNGVMEVLDTFKKNNIKIAIGSSSRNTEIILNRIGLYNYFDAISDGTQIKNSKPDPEVFLLAAKKLGVNPENCLVFEDADSGVEAAIAGKMKVLAVGSASKNSKANIGINDLSYFKYEDILKI